ncbi:MAG: hypothetical protein NC827_03095 [Candidatus Omnitrophica bacterium]|nr:hypothetical protein [Candidatus Omnitrophota bacterium]
MTDMPNDIAIWYQQIPPVAEKGEIIDLMIKLRRKTKKLIHIESQLNNGEIISTVIQPKSPTLKFNFIGFSKEKDRVYIYLENTGEEELKIEKIYCNIEDITKNCYIPQPIILPNSKTLIIYSPEAPFQAGKYLVFKVTTDKEVIAQSYTRVYSHFPIEAFGKDKRAELYFDSETFEIHYPKNKDQLQKLKEEPIFKAIHLLDDPACLDGYSYSLIGTHAKEIIKRAREIYEIDKIHPTIIYACEHTKPYCYFIYGEITDIFSVDPYEIIYYHNMPEKNAYYVSLAKKASQPRLLWTIPEAFTYRGTRFPTAEEERIIVWSEIGEGSKGIWYYVYNQKIGYPANKTLEEEIKKINWELQRLRDYIVISEPFSLAKADKEKVSCYSLLCGDKGIVLILVNNDHKSFFEEGKDPFIYNQKENFEVKVSIPYWLKIKGIKEIKYQEEKEIEYEIGIREIIIPIDKLEITRQFLILTERK